jgi:hypothetical protein
MMKYDKLKGRLKQLNKEIPSNELGVYIIDLSKGEKVSDIKNPPANAVFLIDDVASKLQS